jgi:hypothetical protein
VAIDTQAKRRSAAGTWFGPLGPGVTPNATKPAAWRRQSAATYSGVPDAGAPDPGPAAVAPSNAFRRADTARVFRRLGALARWFRGFPRRKAPVQYDTWPKDASEVILPVFDFSRFPEAVAGETLSAPEIDASSPTGLTLGTIAVTTQDEVVDEHGTTVPAGYGLKVTASGGTAGVTYMLEARATFSGGSVRVVKGSYVVE